jgi:hypothetical protein
MNSASLWKHFLKICQNNRKNKFWVIQVQCAKVNAYSSICIKIEIIWKQSFESKVIFFIKKLVLILYLSLFYCFVKVFERKLKYSYNYNLLTLKRLIKILYMENTTVLVIFYNLGLDTPQNIQDCGASSCNIHNIY